MHVDVFALEQSLAYQVYVYAIPETDFEHPVPYGTRKINATGVTEPMIDGTLKWGGEEVSYRDKNVFGLCICMSVVIFKG